MEGKTKKKSRVVGLWFQRQSRPMFHKIKRKKRGHRERHTHRVRREGRKRNTVQHEEDSRPNSASIVHVAWLTF